MLFLARRYALLFCLFACMSLYVCAVHLYYVLLSDNPSICPWIFLCTAVQSSAQYFLQKKRQNNVDDN